MNTMSGEVDIFDTVDLSIIVVDKDCTITRFNRAAAAMLLLTPESIGRSLDQIEMLNHRPDITKLCAAVIAGGSPSRCEVKHDGKRFLFRIAPYSVAEGATTTGAVLSISNIT